MDDEWDAGVIALAVIEYLIIGGLTVLVFLLQ